MTIQNDIEVLEILNNKVIEIYRLLEPLKGIFYRDLREDMATLTAKIEGEILRLEEMSGV